MMSSARTVEHLVVGGGLAGSMTGLRLAAAGRQVTILEKERFPHHKVCGEFLSREAVEYLNAVGVDPRLLGAQPICFVRLTAKKQKVEAPLPFTAMSLSRSILDEALLVRATQAGCRIERGATVEHLVRSEGTWRARLRGDDSWCSSTAFLATGKHDLRNLERKRGAHGDLVGFKLHWLLAPAQTEALRECMELFLFPGGYGGISLVEGDKANLCLVVRRRALRQRGGWAELLASIQAENPHLAERLSGAVTLWDKPLAVSSIPYGYLAGRPDGLWCVGDQAACVPSFTGDGMSIALHSGALAAQMSLAGQTSDLYHLRLADHLRRGMSLATFLSRTIMSSAGRIAAPWALSVFPHAMNWIAGSTRIPERAVLQTLEFPQS